MAANLSNGDGAPKLKTKGVEAADKALRILSLFENGRSELSLGEISNLTGLVKSSVLRLLVSLQAAGYVAATPDKRYTVGPEAFRVGRVYQQDDNLEAIIRPVLKNLVRHCGESASFFRREGRMRVCLYREDSTQPLREHVAEGDAVPINKGAAGHVFTLFEKSAGDHPADPAQLEKLPIVSIGERGPEIAGLSVPIFGVEGPMLGALSISGPTTRFGEAEIDAMSELLLEAAVDICAGLRARFYDSLVPEDQ